MRDGYLKVAAAALEVKVADCGHNAAEIMKLMEQAAASGVKLLVLPELCLTGYTCGDLFFQQLLLDKAESALERIRDFSRELDMVTVVGAPLRKEGSLFNCAAVINRGKIAGVIPKTRLPNFDEFKEKRYFSPAPSQTGEISVGGQSVPFGAKLIFVPRKYPLLKLAVEVCADFLGPNPPSIAHAMQGANVIANLSASDELAGKHNYRREMVTSLSTRLVCAYVYASSGEGESTTDLVFSGHNMIAENGLMLRESPLFSGRLELAELDLLKLEHERRRTTDFKPERTDYSYIDIDLEPEETALTIDVSRYPFIPGDRAAACREVLELQSRGLKHRIEHVKAETALIGLSGGLDSAWALLVMVRAFELMGRDKRDIKAVTMPCFGTTGRSHANALELARLLGVSLMEIDISEAVRRHFKDIGHSGDDYAPVYENAQARERTQLLMNLANKQGGLVVGPGDLSELALGFTTYNGDHMSMYGVNAGVPKTLIIALVRQKAEASEDGALKRVLLDIADSPISPELLPPDASGGMQKTEELIGPYELHDFFLYHALRWGSAPKKVYRLAKYAFEGEYDKAEILKCLKTFYSRFFSQQFKRSCLPDGPKIGPVSLSPRAGFQMPSDGLSSMWLAELEEL